MIAGALREMERKGKKWVGITYLVVSLEEDRGAGAVSCEALRARVFVSRTRVHGFTVSVLFQSHGSVLYVSAVYQCPVPVPRPSAMGSMPYTP